MEFKNSYEGAKWAASYAKLEFADTYYLAYRDLPAIFLEHTKGRKAIDFGCGVGRSTRFLQKCGFSAIGSDISEGMISKAKEIDPKGDYRLIADGDFGQFKHNSYDLIMSAFTFDNIPTMERKVAIFQGLKNLLNNDGKIINLVSSPDMYYNEWASFSTRDYPENKFAQSGDKVKIFITGIGHNEPVEDIIWTHESYQDVYNRAGLEIVGTYKPMAKGDEPYNWVNETRIAPWVIYVLRSKS
jgi:ubiquinone/menaquinone biosynthesis C-methylase UbiE